MTRRIASLIAAAILAGVAAGVAFPAPVQAVTVYYDIAVHPGGQYDYLTCGWHGQCGPSPSSGNGIDFRNRYPNDSEWRSTSFRSDTSTPVDMADGTITTDNSACQRVKVSIKDDGAVDRGSIWFTHQTKDGSDFTLQGKDVGNWQWFDVANVVLTEPNTLCKFTAPHLHMQTTDSTLFVKNSGAGGWPNYVNPGVHEATDSTSKRVFLSSWDVNE